jgi:prepilin-type N-terminal cleavage/methylation domain-containing protein
MKARSPKRKGVTLSEVIIAMGVLSIIATFNIVKLNAQVEKSLNKARFRELLSVMQQIQYEGWQDRSIVNTVQFLNAVRNKLQVAKFCPNSSATEGCWQTGMRSNGGYENRPGLILHSGAYIYGFAGTVLNQATDVILIDINGPKPPNVFGEDTITLKVCIREDPECYVWWSSYNGKKGPGLMYPEGSDIVPLFQELLR